MKGQQGKRRQVPMPPRCSERTWRKEETWRPEGNTFLVFQKGRELVLLAPPGSAKNAYIMCPLGDLPGTNIIFKKESQLLQEQMVLWEQTRAGKGRWLASGEPWGFAPPPPSPPVWLWARHHPLWPGSLVKNEWVPGSELGELRPRSPDVRMQHYPGQRGRFISYLFVLSAADSGDVAQACPSQRCVRPSRL